jgi:hypothetical protein
MNKFNTQNGQALITLVFFSLIGFTIAMAAIMVSLNSFISSSKFQTGTITYSQAEAGAENAYLKLLRNSNYKGETLTIDNATVTTSITGTNPIIITSIATTSAFLRKVELQVNYSQGKYVVQSWKETY